MTHRIRQLNEKIAFENPFVTVFDDEVEFPGGRIGHYVRVAAAVSGTPVVLLAYRRGTIALVRTYRYPIGQAEWALPRGFSQGGAVKENAQQELLEELGVDEASFRVLGHVHPDSGLLSTRAAVVLAQVEHLAGPRKDVEEVEDVQWVSPSVLDAMIRDGEIEDGFTLASWLLAKLHRALPE
jgi:8-oxo-dGTP pyrophosphatase MutT (NUDIX family)